MSAELVQKVSVHDENNIKGFFGQYRWLSNFEECNIYYRGMWFASTEAAYMSGKTPLLEERHALTKMNPKEARKYGQTIQLHPSWDEIKLIVMYEVNSTKYQIPKYKQLLFETGDKYLEETNWWRDSFWGAHFGQGENHLGKILMYIRDGIKKGYL